MRSKHSSLSARAKLSGKSSATSRPSTAHSSMPQKWAVPQIELQLVDQPGDERQLLGRADRAADAGRVVGRRLPPGRDVFQRLGQIEIFERVVELDGEAWPGQPEQIVGRQPRGVVQDRRIERRVIPPIRGNAALRTHGDFTTKAQRYQDAEYFVIGN